MSERWILGKAPFLVFLFMLGIILPIVYLRFCIEDAMMLHKCYILAFNSLGMV